VTLADLGIIGPAFVAGLLVVATHALLGREVLRRGIIFIDLAIAQIAGLGVIAAAALGWQTHGWAQQGAAFIAALLGALLLRWFERRWPEVLEALIGALFVLAATASLLLLSGNPHGGEHLKELLVGQILWVSYGQLLPIAFLYALVLGLWFGLAARRGPLLFYGLFATTVTASVQLVGVYLVFASLIVPALAVRRVSGPAGLWLAYLTGVVGYGAGLLLSTIWDLPAGALIVWTLAAAGVLVYLATSRGRGEA
jgi:zinc/manganese transport system permease protein